jgi:hypothetical protein
LNVEVKAMWVEALRSGKYAQGRHALRRQDDTFCCLGVLCDLHDSTAWELEANNQHDYTYHYSCISLPKKVQEWAEVDECGVLPSPELGSLMSINDAGVSFSKIADMIEEYL